MSENFDKWLERGKRLGYTGTDLQDFVKAQEQSYFDREERALRRAKESEDLLKSQDEERVKAELVHQRALADIKQKEILLQRDIQREAEEREIEKLKLQMQIKELGVDSPPTSVDFGVKGLRPKLPKFDEDKDDMDAFLERFERFAVNQSWPEEQWAVSLSPLLTGKGLQVYSSIPATEANDFKGLKTALLKRYQLTEDGFRNNFRTSIPESGETVFQFVARLSRYFKRWVDLTEVAQNYNALSDLLIREQFKGTCSESMRLFLRERVPKSVEEMKKLAEQFMEAHGGSITMTKRQQNTDRPPSRLVLQPARPPVVQQNAGNKDKLVITAVRRITL